MNIETDTVASFLYSISDANGTKLEDGDKKIPIAYLHGHRNIMPALEKNLEGLATGDKKTITLSSDEAYGPRRDNTVQKVPIKHLASKHKRLLPGTVVKVNTENGAKDATVIKAGKFMVQLDLNHPFAGKDLVFDVEITEVRKATEDEISHGHAHGPGGHHH